MTTQEIIAAVERTRQIEKSVTGDYDLYGAQDRLIQMKTDAMRVFEESGFNVKEREFKSPSRTAVVYVAEQRKRKVRFVITFHAGRYTNSMAGYYYHILESWWDSRDAGKGTWTTIFLFLVWDKISRSDIKYWWGTRDPCIELALNSHILYHGIGKVSSSKQIYESYPIENCIPKFWVSKLKSGEDLNSRIVRILNYIDDNDHFLRLTKDLKKMDLVKKGHKLSARRRKVK
jgi:hypothetical protein